MPAAIIIAIAAGFFSALILAFAGILVFLWRFGVRRRSVKPRGESFKSSARSSWSKYMSQIIEGRQWFFEMEPERVTIHSEEGLELVGYYLPSGDSARTIILVHGFLSDGNSDFAYALRFYHELGLNILVVHQRAHGESEGKYICYGVKERFDLLRWIELVNLKTPNQDIFLGGISMGAATVLMTLGLYLPANVRGCVADCGYTSPWEEFCHVIRLWYHLPPKPFVCILSFFAKALVGADFRISAADALKRAEVPVLFIHGEKDRFVPPSMSETNFEACASDKQLILVPGAGHGVSFLVETERIRRLISDFIEKLSTKRAPSPKA